MALEWLPQVVSFAAGQVFADTDRYKFVKLNSAGDVVAVTAITDRAIGVLRDDTHGQVGATVGVYVGDGECSVVAAGTIAVNDLIGVDATGQAKKLTEGTDTTQYVHGVAVQSGVAGDRILVHIVIPTTLA